MSGHCVVQTGFWQELNAARPTTSSLITLTCILL
jgi:hypothetical protein